MCISPHSCIVWNCCPLSNCARCLYFLPVSFVLLDVSAGSSSLPLHTMHVPSALALFFVPSPYLNISPHIPSSHLFHPLPTPALSLLSSLLSPCVTLTSTFHRTLLLPPLSLLSPVCLCLSPQDSTSSTGSAELTGIKELDDLSQEIAQLQR